VGRDLFGVPRLPKSLKMQDIAGFAVAWLSELASGTA
jgi:hypothetical protein